MIVRHGFKQYLGFCVGIAAVVLTACAVPATAPTPTPVSTPPAASAPAAKPPAAPPPATTPPAAPSPAAKPPAAPPATKPPPAPPPKTTPAPQAVTPPGYVPPGSVDGSTITYSSEAFNIKAYLSRPKTGDSLPGLIIIHENRGLTGHIEDVARRFASQGYAVLAPDLLSRTGGTAQFATGDDAVAAIGKLAGDGITQDLNAAFKYLQSLPYVRKDRIAVLGYCWGGGNSLLYATRNRHLRAAVVYYGPNPGRIDDVANITGPVLGMYGAEDPRITVNVPGLEEAMKKHGKSFEHKVYPGARHAFFNDTSGNYHPDAARDAWQVTLAFLQKNLKT